MFSTPLLFIAFLRGGKALSKEEAVQMMRCLRFGQARCRLDQASGAAPSPTGSSSTDLGQPAAALMTDRILAIALSSVLVWPHPRNGGVGKVEFDVIKKQQLPWDRVGGEDRRTSSITRT